MLGYVTIGTSDMAKATAFYDALLAEIGAKQLFGQDRIKFYGTGPGAPMLAVCIPYDQGAQASGNGVMVAIPAPGPEAIQKLYDKAMALGATDEGALESGFQACFMVPTFVTSTVISSASTR